MQLTNQYKERSKHNFIEKKNRNILISLVKKKSLNIYILFLTSFHCVFPCFSKKVYKNNRMTLLFFKRWIIADDRLVKCSIDRPLCTYFIIISVLSFRLQILTLTRCFFETKFFLKKTKRNVKFHLTYSITSKNLSFFCSVHEVAYFFMS